MFELHNIRYSVELIKYPHQRIFFNKATVLLSELFKSLSFLSPSNYLEVLPFFLFPFWFIGHYKLIEQRNFKIYLILMILSFLRFKTAIALIYIYIIFIGIQWLYSKKTS